MDWFFRKLDTFMGGTVIAAAAIAASQAQAFLVQYVQRLGGHLDEAKAHLHNVEHGLRYQLMSDTVRQELQTEAKTRVAALQDAYHAIADANVFVKPFALLRYGDQTMLAGTWRDFVPSLSINADSVFYIILAMILGFLAYEFVKLPIVALLQEPRRRKFRKRG
ncbi:MAG: DUF2937 family protein [Rhodospirillaceae bacterium]|nr:DUF2937 family protein [Rhodospirillaceae bacterium]